jgi:hypothetical protein
MGERARTQALWTAGPRKVTNAITEKTGARGGGGGTHGGGGNGG